MIKMLFRVFGLVLVHWSTALAAPASPISFPPIGNSCSTVRWLEELIGTAVETVMVDSLIWGLTLLAVLMWSLFQLRRCECLYNSILL